MDALEESLIECDEDDCVVVTEDLGLDEDEACSLEDDYNDDLPYETILLEEKEEALKDELSMRCSCFGNDKKYTEFKGPQLCPEFDTPPNSPPSR
jgi:hypothetical protein